MANWQEFTLSLTNTVSDLMGTLCAGIWWPVATLIIFFALRKKIGDPIDRVKHMKGPGFEFDVTQTEPENQLKKRAGQQIRVITPEEVVETLVCASFGFKRENLKEQQYHLHRSLLRNGILTKEDLENLLNDKEAIEALSDLYVEELKRSPDHPFDPSALTTWGAILHNANVTERAIEWVRGRLRQGREYAGVHQ